MLTPTIYDLMLKAAFQWEGLRAEEKKLEATELQSEAAIWNSFSVSAGRSHNSSDSSSTSPAGSFDSQTNQSSNSWGAQMNISLMQWFVVNELDLHYEVQKNALKAARMSEALNLSGSYLNYSNTINQRIYFESIEKVLLKFKKMSADGQLILTPDTTASLEVALSDIENLQEDARSQYEISRSDLKKYLNEMPIDFYQEYQRIIELEKTKTGLQPNASDDKDRHDWNGIDWKEIDSLFPIPEDVKTAIRIAKKSPALVIADLQTELSENQWYLAMASVGPFLSFSFNRSDSNTEFSGSPLRTMNDTYSVSLNFRIGGGYGHELSAKGVLEEAAQLNRTATQKSIQNSLETSYLRLNSLRSNIRLSESFIINTIIKNLNKLTPVNSENLPGIIQWYTALGQQLRALTEQIKAFALIKASILAQTGTLLEKMPEANLAMKKELRRKYEEKLKKQKEVKPKSLQLKSSVSGTTEC